MKTTIHVIRLFVLRACHLYVRIVIIFFSILIFGCKCKQPNSAGVSNNDVQQETTNENSNYSKATGKISLQYKSSCGTVIILNTPTEKDTLILIPASALTGFDTDGMEVTFSYRKLRVHNPKGCAGIPIQLSYIKKK